MVEGKTEPESSNFLLNEKRRWQRAPIWGVCLALLQIVVVLFTFPAFMKQHWGYLFSLGHPFYVDLILISAVHILSLIGSNCIMFCIYRAKHPFFEQYRSEPDQPFPQEVDAQKWNSLVRRNVLFLVFNVLIFVPFMGIVTEPDKQNLAHRYDLDSWPSAWQIVWQVIFCMFAEDFAFYCSHRTLHTRWCYRHIHKRHHEYTQPVSIGGEFAHPIEYLLGNVLTVQAGPLMLRRQMHKVSLMVWVIYMTCKSTDEHSGYDFPWSVYRLLPFSAPTSYHNYHHLQNKGNYSNLFNLWDTVFGTNSSYYEHMEKKRKKALKME